MKLWVSILKFMFSKKARKLDEIFTDDLTLCSKCQIGGEDFVNFCGLLRKYELYIITKQMLWKGKLKLWITIQFETSCQEILHATKFSLKAILCLVISVNKECLPKGRPKIYYLWMFLWILVSWSREVSSKKLARVSVSWN